MRLTLKLMTLCSMSALLACSGADSTSNLSPVENAALPQSYPQNIINQIKRNPESIRGSISRHFSRLSVDDKVAVSDLQEIANKHAATTRAKIISDILVLDIDGTGDVSAQEMMSISKGQIQRWNSNNARYLPYGRADINKDNVIALSEMVVFSRKYDQIRYDLGAISHDLFINVFNADNDDYITRAELEAGLDNLIQASLETDGKSQDLPLKNTQKSPSKDIEKIRKAKTAKKPNVKLPPMGCVPQPPSKDDQVVFVSTYAGGGYSSVALGDLDESTEVIRLVIESGDSPLYIMASTFSSRIWLLEGDTKRVKRFITSSHKFPKARVGVSGLPKEKVEFLDKGCLEHFQSADRTDGIIAKAKWTTILNRAPDNIVAAERLATTSIPSGERLSDFVQGLSIINGKQSPPSPELEKGDVPLGPSVKSRAWGIKRFKPDGVLYIDPASVISEHKAIPYEIFPASAGLDQLHASGHLIKIEHNAYKIVKDIPRFPPGMGSWTKIIVGKNIAMPKGPTGNTSIYSEETGECLVKRCR